MKADGAPPPPPLPLSVLRFTGIHSYSYTDPRKVEADVEVTEDRIRDLSLRKPRTSQLSTTAPWTRRTVTYCTIHCNNNLDPFKVMTLSLCSYWTLVSSRSGTKLFIGSFMPSPSLSTPVARSCRINAKTAN